MSNDLTPKLGQNDTVSNRSKRVITVHRYDDNGECVLESIIASQSRVVIDMDDGSYKSVKPRKKRITKTALPDRKCAELESPKTMINNTIIENRYQSNTTQIAMLPPNNIQGYIPYK